MQFGVAQIHAGEIAGKQRRLVAARAGADFDNDALVVGGVFRQQFKPDGVFKAGELCCPRRNVGFRHRPHVGVERRIGEHAVEIGQLGLLAAVVADGLGHIIELRQLARQRAKIRPRRTRRKPMRQLFMAAQDSVEFVGGEHFMPGD